MKKLIISLFISVIVSVLNTIVFIKWIIPVVGNNMERGYYDAFSLISEL